MWPRWMSGVVGSTPSFTRSGRSCPSCRASSPSGSASTAFRVRNRAASPGESGMGPMLDCRPLVEPPRRTVPGGSHLNEDDSTVAEALVRGAPGMPDPPTSTITSPAGRSGGRFARSNGSSPQPPKPPKPRLKKLRLALVLLGPLDPGPDLDGLRDADGGGERPAGAREPRRVRRGARTPCSTRACPAARTATPAPATRSRASPATRTGSCSARARSRPTSRTPSSRSRTSASTSTRAWTTRASPARSGRTSCASSAAQGGSTITQQFVKNALSAQGDRSVFQKLREAALAYHLERKWSKEKVLTQYLNTVYFGNGAYGVESAARTYFGDDDAPARRHDGQGLRGRRPRGRRRDAPPRRRCSRG